MKINLKKALLTGTAIVAVSTAGIGHAQACTGGTVGATPIVTGGVGVTSGAAGGGSIDGAAGCPGGDGVDFGASGITVTGAGSFTGGAGDVGATAAGAGNAGGFGGFGTSFGIFNGNTLLNASAITGGAGGAGSAGAGAGLAGGNGAFGGDGIFDNTTTNTITVGAVTGGAGGAGGADATANGGAGAAGGNGVNITASGTGAIFSTTGILTGGTGGAGGSSGGAGNGALTVGGVGGAALVDLANSSVSGTAFTGGLGGAGGADSAGLIGGAGAAGGAGADIGGITTFSASGIVTGGQGGAGGAGGAAANAVGGAGGAGLVDNSISASVGAVTGVTFVGGVGGAGGASNAVLGIGGAGAAGGDGADIGGTASFSVTGNMTGGAGGSGGASTGAANNSNGGKGGAALNVTGTGNTITIGASSVLTGGAAGVAGVGGGGLAGLNGATGDALDLFGTGTILINNGTINGRIQEGSSSVVTLTNAGAITGILGVNLASTGSVNTIGGLNSTTALDLSGETVDVNVTGSGVVATGTSHQVTLVGGGNEVIGDVPTAAVTDNSLFYNFTVAPGSGSTAGDLELIATLTPGLTTNGNNAGGSQILLGNLAGSANPQIILIQNNLLSAPSKAAFNNDLEATLPTVDGGNMISAINMADGALDLTDERIASVRTGNETGMAAGNAGTGTGFWMQGFGQHANQDERDGVKGYSANTWGGALGLDTANTLDHSLFGIDFSYGRSSVSSDNANSTDTRINSYQATLYGTQNLGHDMFVNGMVAYAWDRDTTVRHDVGGVPGLEADGKYSASQAAARLAAGRDFAMEGMTLTPSVVGDYMYFHPQSYTETGAGGANLNVKYGNFSQLDLGVNLKAGWTFKNAGGGVTKPSIHAGYRYNVLNDNVQATSSFAAGGGTFTTDGLTPGRSVINAGADIKFVTTANWEFSGSYDFEAKSGYTANSGILRATYKF